MTVSFNFLENFLGIFSWLIVVHREMYFLTFYLICTFILSANISATSDVWLQIFLSKNYKHKHFRNR